MELTIKMTVEKYSRTESGKSWKKKPDTTNTENITRKQYNNIIEAIPFFRRLGGIETTVKCYTCIGYVPVQLSSTNPDRSEKVVRKFRFEYI